MESNKDQEKNLSEEVFLYLLEEGEMQTLIKKIEALELPESKTISPVDLAEHLYGGIYNDPKPPKQNMEISDELFELLYKVYAEHIDQEDESLRFAALGAVLGLGGQSTDKANCLKNIDDQVDELIERLENLGITSDYNSRSTSVSDFMKKHLRYILISAKVGLGQTDSSETGSSNINKEIEDTSKEVEGSINE